MAATCDEITSELVAYLDGELADADRRPIAVHVATCLGCRREIERLTTVRRWVAELPPVHPSADFATDFWRRLEGEPASVGIRREPSRAWWWAAPALAAAAVVALSFRFFTTPARVSPAPAAPRVVEAPAAPSAAKLAAAKPAASAAAPEVADVQALTPENLPPELLEHPELFLRLPVVRRLETLEHFEEVRERQRDDGVGTLERSGEGRG